TGAIVRLRPQGWSSAHCTRGAVGAEGFGRRLAGSYGAGTATRGSRRCTRREAADAPVPPCLRLERLAALGRAPPAVLVDELTDLDRAGERPPAVLARDRRLGAVAHRLHEGADLVHQHVGARQILRLEGDLAGLVLVPAPVD